MAEIDTSTATLLRTMGLNADSGWATWPTVEEETGDTAADLDLLANAGLATSLGDGSYWPGHLDPDAAARLVRVARVRR